MRPDQDKVKAITNMPSPTNVEDLCQVLSLINYVGQFLPDLSSKLHAITELLKTDNRWTWDHAQEQAFREVKVKLECTSTCVLRPKQSSVQMPAVMD